MSLFGVKSVMLLEASFNIPTPPIPEGFDSFADFQAAYFRENSIFILFSSPNILAAKPLMMRAIGELTLNMFDSGCVTGALLPDFKQNVLWAVGLDRKFSEGELQARLANMTGIKPTTTKPVDLELGYATPARGIRLVRSIAEEMGGELRYRVTSQGNIEAAFSCAALSEVLICGK